MIALRVLVAFVCGVDLAFMGILIRQVGRHFIPRWQMRGLMVCVMIVTGTIGLYNLLHAHGPVSWFTWALAVGMIGKAVFLGTILHWYGSTVGQRHIQTMLASLEGNTRGKRTQVEQRVDQLVLGVIALFGIAMFTLLVIGVSTYRTDRSEARTHAALCTFRQDLAGRRDVSNMLLTLPVNRGRKVIVVYGLRIPRNVLQNQVEGQDRTLASLRGLRC